MKTNVALTSTYKPCVNTAHVNFLCIFVVNALEPYEKG